MTKQLFISLIGHFFLLFLLNFFSFLPFLLPFIFFHGSDTSLAKMVRSPQLVRDMDWIDWCWPDDRKRDGQFPKVTRHGCTHGLSAAHTGSVMYCLS